MPRLRGMFGPSIPMTSVLLRRLALLFLAAAVVLPAAHGLACEKHAKGHQNSSDTETEFSKSR